MSAAKPHPIQPTVIDGHGVLRFKANAIVLFLLAELPGGLNTIAHRNFSREDREQFAQLIGYSVSGAGDLSYVRPETIDAARGAHERGTTAEEETIAALREQVARLRDAIRTCHRDVEDLLGDEGE